MTNQIPHETERMLKVGAEAGLAAYALHHANRGTPIGQEQNLGATAARTAGNFVIVALLTKLVALPYLAITFVICEIPALIIGHGTSSFHHSAFILGAIVWLYVGPFLFIRKVLVPTDRALSGRDMRTGSVPVVQRNVWTGQIIDSTATTVATKPHLTYGRDWLPR